MDKTYDPNSIEQRWYQQWENDKRFAASGVGAPYCIMIPPPNVTGHLHMGHAFQDTIMDILIRYHRMKGDNTLWQVGTDHAGIATQMVVERQLAARGEDRHSLGRAAFIDKIWEWKAHSGGNITNQLRRMGASVDWQRERFTMDEGLSAAVTEVFVSLYEEGLIYRGKRLVNWDPVLHTAISDLEVESKEENGHMWHLRYPLADNPGQHLIVATTRPETMLGDSAVAVHPTDERYQHLIGQHIALPLTERTIPIIADEYVDPEFGTGCVKITPAHDFNDYEVGKRHDLPLINIFTDNAQINDDAPQAYRGLDRYDARKKIVADLTSLDLLESVDDHKLMVPRGDRSGSVVEPYLTDQWYVKVEPLAKPAIDAVKNGDIKLIPENWDRTYYEWMNNIEDWCISRQIWWGHRVPAWYDEQGNCYVGRDEAAVRQVHRLPNDLSLTQDDDVLDTWFSSALWPFSTLGWPEKTAELEAFYPTSVLVTGFDIIFFWVARMIMMGLKFTGQVPFKEVYIHGLVRDHEGQKMSKSKGNVLDPLDVVNGIDIESLVEKRTSNLMQPEMAKRIEKATRKEFTDGIPAYGMDALRFTFASQATLGRDIRFDLARVEGYRNFCTKLWNAARYVLMNTQGHDCGETSKPVELSAPDRWINARLQQTIDAVEKAITAYRFDYAASTLYDFVWNEYCDWYIELSKPILANPATTGEQARGTRRTLVRVLADLLKLLHPVIPFVTEEIWQQVAPLAAHSTPSIMVSRWPEVDTAQIDDRAIDEIEWLKAVINAVRNIRGEMNLPPRKPLGILLQNGSNTDAKLLKQNEQLLKVVGVIDSIRWLTPADEAPESAVALVGDMQVLIPMAGLIDKEEEVTRLSKEIGKLEKEIEKCGKKLDNPSFIDRAPESVVTQERTRLADFRSSLAQLVEQRQKIERM